jgi:hypothetical protein
MVGFLEVLITLAATSVLWLTTRTIINWRRRSRMPPGPKGWPYIGNVLNFPQENRWLALAQWARTYGEGLFSNNVRMLLHLE